MPKCLLRGGGGGVGRWESLCDHYEHNAHEEYKYVMKKKKIVIQTINIIILVFCSEDSFQPLKKKKTRIQH